MKVFNQQELVKPILILILILYACLNTVWAEIVQAQALVPVTISIRYMDGTPAKGEEVTLLSQPDYIAQTAVTDENGLSIFNVSRGIYEIRFDASLDPVSALAVAEGGMMNFGITVGDEAISYHFTLDNGLVYFDSTPDATVPSPIIPELKDLHFIGGAGEPTPTSLSGTIVLEMKETVTPEVSKTAVSPNITRQATHTPIPERLAVNQDGSATNGLLLIGAIAVGMLLGGIIFVINRIRKG